MCLLLTGHFVKFKIRYIFIMQFGGYFVKFYSRQIFRPYGTLAKAAIARIQFRRVSEALFDDKTHNRPL